MNVTSNCKIHYELTRTPHIYTVTIPIACGFIAILIIVANIRLIRLLIKQRKNTINLSFIILSCSDIFIGAVTLPLIILQELVEYRHYCQIRVMLYASMGFAFFSWNMTLIIAIDRYLIVTRPTLQAKYITRKIIYSFAFINIIYVCGTIFISFFVTRTVFAIIEVFKLIVTGLIVTIYIHLIIIVRQKAMVMKRRRHKYNQTSNFGNRTTKTILLLLICELITLLPYITLSFYIQINKIKHTQFIHYLTYWTYLIILANSFFNAIILICRSTNLQKTRQPCNKTFSHVKDIQKEFPKIIDNADHEYESDSNITQENKR